MIEAKLKYPQAYVHAIELEQPVNGQSFRVLIHRLAYGRNSRCYKIDLQGPKALLEKHEKSLFESLALIKFHDKPSAVSAEGNENPEPPSFEKLFSQ